MKEPDFYPSMSLIEWYEKNPKHTKWWTPETEQWVRDRECTMAKTSKQRRDQRKRAKARMLNCPDCIVSFVDCPGATAAPKRGSFDAFRAKKAKPVSDGEKSIYLAITGNYPNKQEEEQGKDTMDTNTARESRDYLLRRLERIQYAKRVDIDKKFDVNHSSFPISPDQMVKMIKDGKFSINKRWTDAGIIEQAIEDGFEFADDAAKQEYLKNHFMYRGVSWEYIKWDDGFKFDKAGYDAATKAMDKAYKDAKDKIAVLDAEKGLAALQEFDAFTA